MQLLIISGLLFSTLCSIYNLDAKETKTMSTDSTGKSAASPKIAVVNVHRIVTLDPKSLPNASEEWRDLYTKMQETLEPAKKEITEVGENLKKKISEIEALQKSRAVSQEAIQKKVSEEAAPLQYKLQGLQEQAQRFYQEELQHAETVVLEKIQKILDSILITQGWDMILNGSAVIGSVTKRFDVTDEVLGTLNKNYTEEKSEK